MVSVSGISLSIHVAIWFTDRRISHKVSSGKIRQRDIRSRLNQFIVSIHPVSCPTLHLFYIDRCVEYRLHHQLCILIFKLTPTLVTVAVRIRDGLDAQPGTQVILIQGSIRFAYYLYRNIDRILQPYILHCQCHTIRTSVQLLFSVIRPGLHHIIIGRREQGSITITLFLFELCCVSKRRSKMFTGMRFVMSSADDNLGIGIVHFKRLANIHKDRSSGCYGRHTVVYQVKGSFAQGGHHRQSFKTMSFILKGSCATRRIGDSAQRPYLAQRLIEWTVHTFFKQARLTARLYRLRPINAGANL